MIPATQTSGYSQSTGQRDVGKIPTLNDGMWLKLNGLAVKALSGHTDNHLNVHEHLGELKQSVGQQPVCDPMLANATMLINHLVNHTHDDG